jgi:glycosyltransferase involved in cell wall biosynthesis
VSNYAVLKGRAAEAAFPWYIAARFSKSGEYDVIDASSGDAWVYGSLRRRVSAPLLVTHNHGSAHMLHERLLDDVRRGGQRLSWKYPLYNGSVRLWEVARSLRVADLCLFLNPDERDYAVDKLGVSASRCRVLPNGIAQALLDREPAMSEPSEPSAIRIAQIGSYIARKGVAYGAQALNRFLRACPRASVSFLGTGCPPERVLADFDSDIRARILVREAFARSELGDLLAPCHVLLLPSLSEGFPLAVGEGMAAGLCPLVSRIPGPTAIVEHETDGLLFPPADAPAIEAALLRLAADPQLLRRLRVAARRKSLTFAWPEIARRRLEFYEEAIERKRSMQ